MYLKRLIYMICFVLMAGLFACTDIFSVRDAEPPDSNNGGTIFETPLKPDIVMSNFRYAVIQKNVSNYLRCFIDSTISAGIKYRFVPDSRLQKEPFLNWSLIDESSYFQNVIFNASQRQGSVDLTYQSEINYLTYATSPDSMETLPFGYVLKVDFGDSVGVYSGSARMKLIRNANSLWAIYYWEDFPDADNTLQSWSMLKALTRWN